MLYKITIIKTDGTKSYHFHQTRELAEAWLEKQRKYMNISTSVIEPYSKDEEELKTVKPTDIKANPIRKKEQPASSQGTEPKCSPCEEARRKREEKRKNKNQ
jgi:hypothetical protein